MWLAVLFAAMFAPDIVSSSNDGNSTTIPSGVVVALFAVIGTRVVAKYGLGRGTTTLTEHSFGIASTKRR
jgi:hypothetical protein